jgi:hypothetical protein
MRTGTDWFHATVTAPINGIAGRVFKEGDEVAARPEGDAGTFTVEGLPGYPCIVGVPAKYLRASELAQTLTKA